MAKGNKKNGLKSMSENELVAMKVKIEGELLRRKLEGPGKVFLSQPQRDELSRYFSPDNVEGEPMPLDEPFEILVENGQLCINGAWLHFDGEWATFKEQTVG